MKALMALPPCETDGKRLERAVRAASYRIDSSAELNFSAPDSHIGRYREIFPDREWLSYSETLAGSYGVVIIVEGAQGEKVAVPVAAPEQIIFIIDRMGKIDIVAGDWKGEGWAAGFSRHIFNRLYTKPEDAFYFFPYGYLFRLAGMGPINEYGFRIKEDLEHLEGRDGKHIVAAVFGGSAAWSIYSHYEEMFAARLEEKLNAGEAARRGLRFTVLNFAQNGHVVLNEIFTYVLFCHKIKPEIVIAHDGFNDLAYGQQSDDFLLNKSDISYQHNLEVWARMLHESKEIKLAWPDERGHMTVINYPRAIVKAYLARLKQFQDIVTGMGGKFIAGLQPILPGKKEMSEFEKERLGNFFHKEPPCRHMPYLYERMLRKMPDAGIRHFVNLQDLFGRFGADRDLFGDFMHTVPAGDEEIALFYMDYLEKNILPDIIGRKCAK